MVHVLCYSRTLTTHNVKHGQSSVEMNMLIGCWCHTTGSPLMQVRFTNQDLFCCFWFSWTQSWHRRLIFMYFETQAWKAEATHAPCPHSHTLFMQFCPPTHTHTNNSTHISSFTLLQGLIFLFSSSSSSSLLTLITPPLSSFVPTPYLLHSSFL